MAKATKKVEEPTPQKGRRHLLRFTTLCAPYNTGEIAGFTREHAVQLIKRGVAVPVSPGEVEKLTVKTGGQAGLTKKISTVGAVEDSVGIHLDPLHQEPIEIMSDEEAEMLLKGSGKSVGQSAGGPDDDI